MLCHCLRLRPPPSPSPLPALSHRSQTTHTRVVLSWRNAATGTPDRGADGHFAP